MSVYEKMLWGKQVKGKNKKKWKAKS